MIGNYEVEVERVADRAPDLVIARRIVQESEEGE
jgi:hypothetical protein